MLNYKDIIIKHYVLHMFGRQIASAPSVSKSGASCIIQIEGISRKKVEKRIPQCKIRLPTLDG